MPVRKRGTSWQADVRIHGKRYRKDVASEADGWRWVGEMQDNAKRGVLPQSSPDRTTMRELADLAYSSRWAGTKSEDSSRANADDVVEMFGANRDPATVRERDIDEVVARWRKRGVQGSTINRKLSALSVMLKLAYRRRYIDRLPLPERQRENPSRQRYYTSDEEKKILKWFRDAGMDDEADLVSVLLDTGLRLSEALRLRPVDVSPLGVRVTDSKSASSTRTVPLTLRARAVLEDRCPGENTELFPSLTVASAGASWDKMRAALGYAEDADFVLHTCRHTFCSRLIQRGVQLLEVKALAGHSSIATTMRYAHLAPGTLANAVTVLEPGHRTDYDPTRTPSQNGLTGSEKCDHESDHVTKTEKQPMMRIAR